MWDLIKKRVDWKDTREHHQYKAKVHGHTVRATSNRKQKLKICRIKEQKSLKMEQGRLQYRTGKSPTEQDYCHTDTEADA